MQTVHTLAQVHVATALDIQFPDIGDFDEVTVIEVEAFRVQLNLASEKAISAGGAGLEVTMLAFLIKGCVAELQKFPTFKSSLDGDSHG